MVDQAQGLYQPFESGCPDVSHLITSTMLVGLTIPQITSRLTVDAQTVQSGTAEKVGIFLQSVSYLIVSFIVGFILNARLTGVLLAAVIPSMTLAIISGTTFLDRFSKAAAESTTSASSIAEGAIKAVQVVQAFDAFESLATDHKNHLRHAMRIGMKKAVAGAMLLGSVFFVASVEFRTCGNYNNG